jgi:hypothetical protein
MVIQVPFLLQKKDKIIMAIIRWTINYSKGCQDTINRIFQPTLKWTARIKKTSMSKKEIINSQNG